MSDTEWYRILHGNLAEQWEEYFDAKAYTEARVARAMTVVEKACYILSGGAIIVGFVILPLDVVNGVLTIIPGALIGLNGYHARTEVHKARKAMDTYQEKANEWGNKR